MSTTQPNRILAVEIRAGRLGYAVLETPNQLRDFGAAWFDAPVAARSRVARLLRLDGRTTGQQHASATGVLA